MEAAAGKFLLDAITASRQNRAALASELHARVVKGAELSAADRTDQETQR